jgi:two-component system, sensor histidine kinase YesM
MREFWHRAVQQLKRLRIQVFWAYFAVLTPCFIMVSIGLVLAARQVMIQQIGGSRLDILRQIGERANTMKTSTTTLVDLYRYELDAQGFVGAPLDAEAAVAARMYLDSQKTKYDGLFHPIGLEHDLMVLGGNGFSYSSLHGGQPPTELGNQLWYRRLVQSLGQAGDGGVRFSSTFRDSSDDGCGTYRFAAGRLMQCESYTSTLLVLIDEQVLEDLYTPALSEGSEIYIYDQEGRIVSHRDKKMLGKQFVDVTHMNELYGADQFTLVKKLGSDYLLTTYLDEGTGWTIVEEIPARTLFGVLDRMYVLMGVVLAVCLILSLAVALWQSRRISRPLTQLSEVMDAFGSRDFVPLQANTGTLELDHLRQSFNHMAVEIFHLMDAVTEREQQKRILEMNFLRAQINPHFLYNMLFSIRCTMEIGKSGKAVQMIEAFTDLLKSTLKATGDTISLADEFENTRKYMVVQKLRYGETVHYEMDLGEGTGECMVPPLILQPLVENAIFHGLEAKESADMVVVSSAFEGSDLILTVTDDGAGMDARTLEMVRRRTLDGMRETESDSIGLANVHSRIRLNYGAGYGLTLDSVSNIGTTVMLRLPARGRVNTLQGKGGAVLESVDR